jgi:hypothetical protein
MSCPCWFASESYVIASEKYLARICPTSRVSDLGGVNAYPEPSNGLIRNIFVDALFMGVCIVGCNSLSKDRVLEYRCCVPDIDAQFDAKNLIGGDKSTQESDVGLAKAIRRKIERGEIC